MTLTVNDTILDEEFRNPTTPPDDEHDVPAVSAPVQAAIDAVSDSTDFYSSPAGFPQYAENTDFYSSDQAVSDLFLAYNGSGDPWPAGGVATDLYVGSDQVYLFASSDDNIVFGRIGGASGDIVLVIAVDETKVDGFVTAANLWTGIYAPLVQDGADLVDSADQLDLSGLIYLGSDFDTTTEVPFDNFATVPSGQDAFALVGPTSGSSTVDLLLTGFAGTTVGTVNVSTQGLGSNAQHVDEGESIRIDIVDANAANFANADAASEVHVESNLGYAGGHKDAIAATFEIEQINPTGVVATCSVFAYHTGVNVQGTGFNANAISSPGDAVQIDVEDVVILNAAGDDITQDFLDRGGTIVANGQGVKISGLLVHEQVHFSTDSEAFNRFVVTNSDATKGPDTFDVGSIKVTVLEGGSGSEYAELGSHLIYQDDGPNIDPSGEVAPSLMVDESDFTTNDTDDYSGLFDSPDYGADGEGSLGYTLGVSAAGADSGLTDTATGNSVFLFLESGEVVGREGTDAADAETGDEVFRVSVDSDGKVTLDQSLAVMHDDVTDPDDLTGLASAGLITLTATVHDSEAVNENDSDSATVGIGDTFLFKDDGPTIDESSGEDLLVTNGVAGDSASGDFDLDANNDQNANVTIVGAPDSDGFTFDGAGTDSITGKLNGEDLYTLSVDDDGGYLFTLIGELASTEDHLDVTDIKAGGPDTNFITVGTTLTDDYVKLSGFDASDNPAAINESNANVGVKNGNLDNGESIKFELFDENDDPINFLGLNIGTKSAKASDYTVFVDFVDPLVADISFTQHVAKNGTLVVDPAGDDLIQSITIEKVTGPALKLGLGDIDILRPPGDFQLGFDVQLTDGDGDFVGASFIVEIDGDADGFITDPFII